jgi:hypothetical protein
VSVIPQTKLGVLSLALVRLGENPISSLESTDPIVNQASEIYDLHKVTALSEHPWRFALRFRQLAALSNKGSSYTPDYTYAYQVPNEALQVRGLHSRNQFEIFKGELYTNDNPAKLLYIEDVDEADMPEYFRLALSFRVSSELAFTIIEDQQQQQWLAAQADKHFKKARRIDSQSSFKFRMDYRLLEMLNQRPVRRG